MKRVFSLLVCSLLMNSPVFAQQEIVSAVKNDLIARHVTLTGPCGAFEITKRVAWILRAQGVGLLDKPGGNMCQGYSVDYLVFPDFSGRDILGDAGGENAPAWSAEPNEPTGAFVGRWRAAFDPGDTIVPVPPVPPIPPVPDLSQAILEAIQGFRKEARDEAILAHEERVAQRAFREKVGVEWKKVSSYLVVITSAFVAGKFVWGRTAQ